MSQGDRLFAAEALASSAQLFLINVSKPGLRIREGVLEIGPGTTPDEIATQACRRILALSGKHDESLVRYEVRRRGFGYTFDLDSQIRVDRDRLTSVFEPA